ncbi:MAG: hypothetical protein M3Y72_23535, partial [Acidobacteriota bacterium]|nr:hypothetical protein [Acidobacteriota bacterium]
EWNVRQGARPDTLRSAACIGTTPGLIEQDRVIWKHPHRPEQSQFNRAGNVASFRHTSPYTNHGLTDWMSSPVCHRKTTMSETERITIDLRQVLDPILIYINFNISVSTPRQSSDLARRGWSSPFQM